MILCVYINAKIDNNEVNYNSGKFIICKEYNYNLKLANINT